MNENESQAYQHLCDAVKSVLRGKFTAVNTFIEKGKASQSYNPPSHLKTLEEKSTLNLNQAGGGK